MTPTTEGVMQPLQEWLDVPLLQPPMGLTAEKELLLLKERYPQSSFIPGRKRAITPELENSFLLLLSAFKHFERQAALVKNDLRQVLGNAEFAVSSADRSIVIAQRRFMPKSGYTVDPFTEDAIYKMVRR